MVDPMDFEKELTNLINRHSKESGSNTPDFILAALLHNVLDAFNTAVQARDRWHTSKTSTPLSFSVPTPTGVAGT